MELRQLRYFIAIAEAGSFSAAAARLFVAQPALSVQIRRLEEEVGRPLLLRHRRGVTLTAAGQGFLGDARQLLAQAQMAVGRARQDGTPDRRLRLGLLPSATHGLLSGLVRALAPLQPSWRIEALEMPTQAQIDGLREGRLDFSLGRPARSDGAVQALLVHDDPYCLALPAGHRLAGRQQLSLAAVATEDFVSFGRDRGANYFDRTIAMCVESGFSPAIRHEASTFSSALGMVAAGLGVSIVPASCALIGLPGVVVRRLPASRHRSRLALLAAAERRHPLHGDIVAIARRELVHLRREVRKAMSPA